MSNNLKTWPKKIYLQGTAEDKKTRNYHELPSGYVTHCEDRIYDSDVEYIRADIAKEMEAQLQQQLQDQALECLALIGQCEEAYKEGFRQACDDAIAELEKGRGAQ